MTATIGWIESPGAHDWEKLIGTDQEGKETCAICLEDLLKENPELGVTVVKIAKRTPCEEAHEHTEECRNLAGRVCGHMYHGKCLREWLAMARRQEARCPVCRTDFRGHDVVKVVGTTRYADGCPVPLSNDERGDPIFGRQEEAEAAPEAAPEAYDDPFNPFSPPIDQPQAPYSWPSPSSYEIPENPPSNPVPPPAVDEPAAEPQTSPSASSPRTEERPSIWQNIKKGIASFFGFVGNKVKKAGSYVKDQVKQFFHSLMDKVVNQYRSTFQSGNEQQNQ